MADACVCIQVTARSGSTRTGVRLVWMWPALTCGGIMRQSHIHRSVILSASRMLQAVPFGGYWGWKRSQRGIRDVDGPRVTRVLAAV